MRTVPSRQGAQRRTWLRSQMRERSPEHHLLFLESICSDERIIQSNVRETKLKSPDYKVPACAFCV